MRKKFTMLLASLFLVMGATNAQVTKYYKPGERKATFTVGDKVMFYNTALVLNSDRTGISQDRTGFLIGTTSFALDKQKPKNAPIFSEKVGVFTVETVEDQSTYYKVNVKGANGYVGIGGAVNNANASTLCFHKWTTVADNKKTGDDVGSENATGEGFVKRTEITYSDNLWIVANDGMGTLWNGNQETFTTWSTGHPYAIYSVVEAETADLEAYLANAKTTAKNSLQDLAKLSLYETTSAVANVEAVALENDDLETALKTIDEIVLNVKKSVDGKNVKFCNKATDARGGKYLGYDNANNRAAAIANNGDAVIWTIKTNSDGTFKLYNFVNDLYLGTPGANSGGGTPMHATASDAPSFYFIPTAENVVALATTGGQMVHVNNGNNYRIINHWSTTDAASLWDVTSVPAIVVDHETLNSANAARLSLPYAIQQAYGLVTDATKFSSNAKHPDEGTYEGLLDNFYNDENNGVKSYFHSRYNHNVGDYHYLQAELSEAGTEFFFYFKKRQGNNYNRPTKIEILGSADGTNFTIPVATISEGLPTEANDIEYLSAKITATENVKHLRFVVKQTNTPNSLDATGGHPFFTFSEFYIFPAGYGVEGLVESYKNFASLSITDDAMAEAAEALASAEASLALSNIKKEANAILTANADKHEATPALGKYATAAYEALQNACTNGTTEAEIRTAIDNFTKSLNKPVYIIKSAWDAGYSAGTAIYYDGTKWKCKKANRYDRQMWMTIPNHVAEKNTEGDVPAPFVNAYDANGTSYEICDYPTGTVMRNKSVQIVKVPSWEGAYSLQYNANGESTDAAQHVNSSLELVNWKTASVDDCQPSAWNVEYIGNTYDLDQLTDEYLSALSNLEAAVITNYGLFYAEEGNGLGQYQSELDPMKDALNIGGGIVSLSFANLLNEINDDKITLEQIQNYTTTITETELNINQPSEGYYRIKGANQNVSPYAYYLTGKTNGDGGRIALQAEADASTVFHYKDGKLQAVQSGLYVGLNSSHYTFQIYANNAPTMTFGASTYAAGAYTIMSDRYLRYKIYNGEVELDRSNANEANTANDAWYLEEVSEEDIPTSNALTAINDIDENATYRIYGERGFIYVADDGNLKSTYKQNNPPAYSPFKDKHHFAIVTIGKKKYLYNVGAKKFVIKSNKGVALVDYPEHAITIEAASNQSTDYDWTLKINGGRMNLTDAAGHTYGIESAYDTEDPGNRWAIYKVGTFNPAEAKSMKKVTVNYAVDGQEFTKISGVAANSTLNFSYAFATVTSCKVNDVAQRITNGACSVTVQDNMTISVEIDQNLPFEAALNDSKILSSTWYYLQMHSNQKKYIQYLPDHSDYIEWIDAEVKADSIATYSWAFVGNVVEGFKMINFAATTIKALKATDATTGNPSMADLADGTAFVLSESSTGVKGGFCMKRLNNNDRPYLNAQNGKVAYWESNDAGSTFVVTPSPVVPTRGKFYRIKSNSRTAYLSSGTGTGRTQFVANEDATTIFYYDGKLLSYSNGMYLANSNGFLNYTNTIGESAGTPISFSPSTNTNTNGKICVVFMNGDDYRCLYFTDKNGNSSNSSSNAGSKEAINSDDENYFFTFEEVTTLPVTISDAQVEFDGNDKCVSTLFTPVALNIPDGITAYIGVNEDNYLAMEPLENIIPANTGVILMANEAKTYDFTISAEAGTAIEAEDNIITGTVAKAIITPENETCYILANDTEDGVGLYKAMLNKNASGAPVAENGTSFINNAFKAYIPVPKAEQPQAAKALTMRLGRGQGTTEIELPTANGQQPTAVYDLMGRRVLNPTKGMYIVNGKKVLF